MSFLTCFWLFPQKEHLSRSAPSPIRATVIPSVESDSLPARRRQAARAIVRAPPLHTTPGPMSAANGPIGVSPSSFTPLPGRPWSRAPRPRRLRSGLRDCRSLAAGQHLVDDPVLDRLLGGEDLVALDVVAHHGDVAPGVLRERVLEPLAHPDHLVRVDLDVRRLRIPAALDRRLVDEYARVRQRESLAGGAGREQDRRRRGGLTEAHGLD